MNTWESIFPSLEIRVASTYSHRIDWIWQFHKWMHKEPEISQDFFYCYKDNMLRICTTRVLWTADIDCHPFSAKAECCKIYILFRIDDSYRIFVDLASLISLVDRAQCQNKRNRSCVALRARMFFFPAFQTTHFYRLKLNSKSMMVCSSSILVYRMIT